MPFLAQFLEKKLLSLIIAVVGLVLFTNIIPSSISPIYMSKNLNTFTSTTVTAMSKTPVYLYVLLPFPPNNTSPLSHLTQNPPPPYTEKSNCSLQPKKQPSHRFVGYKNPQTNALKTVSPMAAYGPIPSFLPSFLPPLAFPPDR